MEQTLHESDIFQEVITALTGNQAFAEFRDAIEGVADLFGDSPTPITDLLERGGPVALLVASQLGGLLDESRGEIGLPPEDVVAMAREAGNNSVTRQVLMLADVQPNSEAKDKSVATINECVDILNGQLGNLRWPDAWKSPTQGEQVAPDCVVWAGDLTQTGGNQAIIEQVLAHASYLAKDVRGGPWSYHGGFELCVFRAAFQKGFTFPRTNDDFKYYDVHALKYQPQYFGLGNHDMESNPNAMWWWFKPKYETGRNLPEDTAGKEHYRYQMWNFIQQMHFGYSWVPDKTNLYKSPLYPVTSGDPGGVVVPAPPMPEMGTVDWRRHSLNYTVELGPLVIIQLHAYGGDDQGGSKTPGTRASGLDWLEKELAQIGNHKPILIVQHAPFDLFDGLPEGWTKEKQVALLTILQDYNVIGLFVGHVHNNQAPTKVNLETPDGTVIKTFIQYRPGGLIKDENTENKPRFGLLRMSPFHLQYLDCCINTAASPNISITASYEVDLIRKQEGRLAAESSGYRGNRNIFELAYLNSGGTEGDEVLVLQTFWDGDHWAIFNGMPRAPKPINISGGIAACSWSRYQPKDGDRHDVFCLADDGSMLQLWWKLEGDRGQWLWNVIAPPSSTTCGNIVPGTLTAVAPAWERMYIFALSTLGGIIYSAWDNENSFDWVYLSRYTSNPIPCGIRFVTAAAYFNGVRVFALGEDGHLYQMNGVVDGGIAWNNTWTDHGDLINGTNCGGDVGPLASACWGSDNVQVFTIGRNGVMVGYWKNGEKSGFSDYGAPTLGPGIALNGAVTALSSQTGRYDVFARTTDAQITHCVYNGDTWIWKNDIPGDENPPPIPNPLPVPDPVKVTDSAG